MMVLLANGYMERYPPPGRRRRARQMGDVMKATSRRLDFAAAGVRLETTLGANVFTCVVLIGTDPRAIPDAEYGDSAEVHMTLVEKPRNAKKRAGEMLPQVKTGDTVVFLCPNRDTYQATLDVLGFNGGGTVFDSQ